MEPLFDFVSDFHLTDQHADLLLFWIPMTPEMMNCHEPQTPQWSPSMLKVHRLCSPLYFSKKKTFASREIAKGVKYNKKIGTLKSLLTRLRPGRLWWHLGAQSLTIFVSQLATTQRSDKKQPKTENTSLHIMLFLVHPRLLIDASFFFHTASQWRKCHSRNFRMCRGLILKDGCSRISQTRAKRTGMRDQNVFMIIWSRRCEGFHLLLCEPAARMRSTFLVNLSRSPDDFEKIVVREKIIRSTKVIINTNVTFAIVGGP